MLSAEKLATVRYLFALEAYEDACALLGWKYTRGSVWHHLYPSSKLATSEIESLVSELGLTIDNPTDGPECHWLCVLQNK